MRTPKQKSPAYVSSVDGLSMVKLRDSIKWMGMVHLGLLNEDDPSYLSDVEWPAKSGKMYYGCASTGLLFDKQSGRCLQSSNVNLIVDTVEPAKCTGAQFDRWKNERIRSDPYAFKIKPGPKPKGSVRIAEDEYDFA